MLEEDSLLVSGAHKLGVALTEEHLQLFHTYRDTLLTWNQQVNLTSITDPKEVVLYHFLDSLTVLAALDRGKWSSPLRLLDVGTGAGFPGIPLKLVCPSFALTLLESVGKKVAFLTHLTSLLGLQGVNIIKGRAEEIAHLKEHREGYDVVVSRAVASLPVLAELTLPFCQQGGIIVAQKKGDIQAEIEASYKALEVLGGSLGEVKWLNLQELGDPRALVVIRKIAPTPQAYPRRAGIPAKRPIQ